MTVPLESRVRSLALTVECSNIISEIYQFPLFSRKEKHPYLLPCFQECKMRVGFHISQRMIARGSRRMRSEAKPGDEDEIEPLRIETERENSEMSIVRGRERTGPTDGRGEDARNDGDGMEKA